LDRTFQRKRIFREECATWRQNLEGGLKGLGDENRKGRVENSTKKLRWWALGRTPEKEEGDTNMACREKVCTHEKGEGQKI